MNITETWLVMDEITNNIDQDSLKHIYGNNQKTALEAYLRTDGGLHSISRSIQRCINIVNN